MGARGGIPPRHGDGRGVLAARRGGMQWKSRREKYGLFRGKRWFLGDVRPLSCPVLQEASCKNHRVNRVVFLGSTKRLLTTGVSRWNTRQIALWDQVRARPHPSPASSSLLGCLNPKNPILGGWEGLIHDKASLETPKLGTGTSPAMVPRGKALGLSPDNFIARLLIGIFPLLRRICPCPSSRRRSTGSRGCSSPSTTRTRTCCTWLARCARRGRGPGAGIGVFVRPRPQPNPNPALLPRSLQGDGNIRYYEIGSEKPYLSYLMEFRSPAPQKGLGKDCRAARPPLPNPNVPKVAGRKCLIKRCR